MYGPGIGGVVVGHPPGESFSRKTTNTPRNLRAKEKITMSIITTDETAILDDLTEEETIQADAHARDHALQAAMQRDLNLFCITPQVNRRRDPEPAQVRDRWED